MLRPVVACPLMLLPLFLSCGRYGYDPLKVTSQDSDAAHDTLSVDSVGDSSLQTDSAPPDVPADVRVQTDVETDVRTKEQEYASRGCDQLAGLVACDRRNQRRNFAAATAFCIELGLRLAAVTTLASHNALTQWAQAKDIAEVMIGGTDGLAEGRWMWPDGTPFWMGNRSGQAVGMAFVNWAPGEPNDANSTEDCMTIYVPGSSWNDVPCSLGFAGIACE